MKLMPLPISRTCLRADAVRAHRRELVAHVVDRAEEQRAVDAQQRELRAFGQAARAPLIATGAKRRRDDAGSGATAWIRRGCVVRLK